MNKNEMTFKSVNLRAPYIVDEDSKCLRQLHLTTIVYDLSEGATKLTWLEAETGDFVFGDLSDKRAYGNESLFKNGEQLTMNDLYTDTPFEKILMWAASDRYRNVRNDNGRCFTWVYENGVATKLYFDERVSKITVTFGADGCASRKIELDVDIPETYHNADEVYEFNDYEIVNNDGSKIYHEGICKRLTLTDEQNVLLDKLQAVIDECKAAKINVSFDFCDYKLVAYNVANIDRVEYDPSYDEETEVANYLNLRNARTIRGIYDINSEDSSLQFVVSKSSLKTQR